jgi:serine/threonine protein kinase
VFNSSIQLFSKRKLQKLIEQLTLGLKFLHDHGMAHLDVKPHNLGLDKFGDIVILDFDHARKLEVDKLMPLGYICGTKDFIPDDFVNQKKQYTPKQLDDFALQKTVQFLHKNHLIDDDLNLKGELDAKLPEVSAN